MRELLIAQVEKGKCFNNDQSLRFWLCLYIMISWLNIWYSSDSPCLVSWGLDLLGISLVSWVALISWGQMTWGQHSGKARPGRATFSQPGGVHSIPHLIQCTVTQWNSMTHNDTMTHNETQWHTMTHNDTQRNTNTHNDNDTQWHTMTHNDTQLHTMTHNETQWHTMTHNDTQWHTMTYNDT